MEYDSKKVTIGIYSMRLAGYLMQQGFVLLSMDRNTDGSNRNVFFFNDTAELRIAMEKYIVSRKA